MRQKPMHYCAACPYFLNKYIPPDMSERSLSASLVLIGEAPGRIEIEQGEYFVGPSGQVLDVILDESGIDRNDVALLNVIRCDPGGTSNVSYHPLAVEMCTRLLLQDIETINPQVLIPMGNLALKAILNKQGITKARGNVTTLESGMHVVPTLHPAFVLRQPAHAELVVSDLEIADKLSREERITSTKNTDYREFRHTGEVYTFFAEAHEKGYYSLDTETTSLDYRTAQIISLSVSHTPYTARVLPFYRLPDMVQVRQFWQRDFIQALYSELMNHPETTVFMQNGKFDLRMLNQFFRDTLQKKVRPRRMRWIDTQNMGALLNENIPHNLKVMARLYTDIEYDQEELALVNKGKVSKMTPEQLIAYSSRDADATLRLGLKFETDLKSQSMWHLMVGEDYADMPVLKCLFEMEEFGAPLSEEKMQEMRSLIQKKLASLYATMVHCAREDFNPNSHPQVRRLLFDVLRLPAVSVRTPKGEFSTDKHAVEELLLKLSDTHVGRPFVESLKLHRQYGTILNTFVEGAEKRSSKSRLHPDFLSARTVSGRIVCVNPNLANIPRDKEFEEGLLLSVRGLYVARPGWYIPYADFSQIEFKCAALIAGDMRLITALFDEGADFHTLTAEVLFPEFLNFKRREKVLLGHLEDPSFESLTIRKIKRRLTSVQLSIKTLRTNAKVYNFGQLYGGGDEGLAGLMGISVAAVQELTKRRARAYPQLARFIELTPQLALEQGYLDTAYGRRRRFPYTPDPRVRSEQGRQGINVLPQSAAAYVGRAALVRINTRMKKLRLRGMSFNVVYDAILNEHPREELYTATTIMTEEMTRPVPELENRSFSIDFGIGKTWEASEKAAVKVSSAMKSQEEIDTLLPYLHTLVS